MKDNKKVKLSLNDLKVQSFVTSLSEDQQRMLLGGESGATCTTCPPTQTACWTNCKKTLAC